MVKTAEEVNALIPTVAGLRDTLDQDNATAAAQMDTDSDSDDTRADGYDADMDIIRAAIDTQRTGATEIQKNEIRVKSRQADLLRQRAAKRRKNAIVLRSLDHAKEKVNAKEI